MRATPEGALSFVPAPIPAEQLGFDPTGGLWLASNSRLVHDEPAGALRRQAARHSKVTPSFKTNRKGYGKVSLAGLRRARGFKIHFNEPVSVEAFLVEPREEDPFTGASEVVAGGARCDGADPGQRAPAAFVGQAQEGRSRTADRRRATARAKCSPTTSCCG